MSTYGGYLFAFDEVKSEKLLKDIRWKGYFTDIFSVGDLPLPKHKIGMCFISFGDRNVSYAALMRWGGPVPKAKYSVGFVNFVQFLPPISYDEILANIGETFPSSINDVSQTVWSALLNYIKKIRPDSASNLNDLETKVFAEADLTDFGFNVMAQEKDAIGLALAIFGYSGDHLRSKLSNWTFSNSLPAPFLQGLKGHKLPEDIMINHDATLFGDSWDQISRHRVGYAIFENNEGETLTLMNVNRTNVEHTLGVDLLYYHHRFNSFVMVQYKRMLPAGNHRRKEAEYRPTDKSYKSEIQRMSHFEQTCIDTSEELKTDDYRLHPGVFYFKLCPSVDFNPHSEELIEGMYLPLDYWQVLLKSFEVKGKRSGIRITSENLGRYFDNTLFIQLSQAGWIGSRSRRSEVLCAIIKQSLENNRGVTVAISSPKNAENQEIFG